HGPRYAYAAGAKEDPTQTNKMKGRDNAERTDPPLLARFPLRTFAAVFPPMIDRDAEAMPSAPHDKGPRRAVPQSGDQHGQDHVAVLIKTPLADAAKGRIE